MTTTSLNGWPSISQANDSRLVNIVVPGTSRSILIRREAAPLVACALAEIHAKLIPLNVGPLDGWSYREARMGGGMSNHSSGTAVDFRYDVLLADRQLHWPKAKHDAMHKILAKYVTSKGKSVFGWGGDWTPGRSADEMHLELIQAWSKGSQGSDCTLEDVQDVIKRLGIRPDGTQSVVGKVVQVLPPPKPKRIVSLKSVQMGNTGAPVRLLQNWLAKEGGKMPLDGKFGPLTRDAYALWQRKLGFTGKDADGIPGRASLVKLAKKYGYSVVA
jgi:hypothetical protein